MLRNSGQTSQISDLSVFARHSAFCVGPAGSRMWKNWNTESWFMSRHRVFLHLVCVKKTHCYKRHFNSRQFVFSLNLASSISTAIKHNRGDDMSQLTSGGEEVSYQHGEETYKCIQNKLTDINHYRERLLSGHWTNKSLNSIVRFLRIRKYFSRNICHTVLSTSGALTLPLCTATVIYSNTTTTKTQSISNKPVTEGDVFSHEVTPNSYLCTLFFFFTSFSYCMIVWAQTSLSTIRHLSSFYSQVVKMDKNLFKIYNLLSFESFTLFGLLKLVPRSTVNGSCKIPHRRSVPQSGGAAF